MTRKVEQLRKLLDRSTWVSRIWQSGVRVAEFIEEGVNHCIDSRESLSRGVLKETRNKFDGICVRLPEHLVEWMRLDLREFVLHVVWIHGSDLVPCRRTQDFDDLHKLIDTRLARE